MKKLLLLFFLFLAHISLGQQKYTTSNGLVHFEASVPLFEAVAAQNNQVSCDLNATKSHITFVVYITDFQFKRSLMKEHFNANYIESHRYPKAIFKGIIEKFDLKNLATTPKTHYLNGTLYIHGKSKAIRVPAAIQKSETGIRIISDFIVDTDSFAITIPYIVRNKIAKKVQVSVVVNLE
ncbi:YceI family protein [Flavobacterium crassostreae]|uniref:Lipid/polyisoprenoid-binding YceI-like domain-containing protein n=1 Tax=Flavobacterium crassostreae TaxID=1763534 RepID=A0A1B9E7F9_9FLAO|nr:YceI family protein [Flavobacterium crassostreae]OCB77884.1 hypothetical protein LPBF_02735 [Flavobacterium crassostreae]